VQGLILAAARASFVDALNTILLVAAGVAFLGMVVAVLTIRQRDFHKAPEQAGTGELPGEPDAVAA
jgi:hypothetical protein